MHPKLLAMLSYLEKRFGSKAKGTATMCRTYIRVRDVSWAKGHVKNDADNWQLLYSLEDHSDGVALAAILVGEALGLSQEAQTRLGCAGLLHDFGKAMSDLDLIYRKVGSLRPEEKDRLRAHIRNGSQFLRGQTLRFYTSEEAEAKVFFRQVRLLLETHHEGLMADVSEDLLDLLEEACPEIQIIIACDKYRAYREQRDRDKFSHEDTIKQLRLNAEFCAKKGIVDLDFFLKVVDILDVTFQNGKVPEFEATLPHRKPPEESEESVSTQISTALAANA